VLPGSLKSLERGSHSFISPAGGGLRPGAPHIVPEWKAEIVGYAAREIAKLQQDLGTKAEVIIDSGNVCKLLNRAVDQAKETFWLSGTCLPAVIWGERQRLCDHSRVAHPGDERVRTQATCQLMTYQRLPCTMGHFSVRRLESAQLCDSRNKFHPLATSE